MMRCFPALGGGSVPGWSPLIHKSSISWSSLVKLYWGCPLISLKQQNQTAVISHREHLQNQQLIILLYVILKLSNMLNSCFLAHEYITAASL